MCSQTALSSSLPSSCSFQQAAHKCLPWFHTLCAERRDSLGWSALQSDRLPLSFFLPVVVKPESWLLWNSTRLFLVRNFGVSQSLFQHQPAKILIFIITASWELICYWHSVLVSWGGRRTGPGDSCEVLGDSRSGIWLRCGGKRKRDSS